MESRTIIRDGTSLHGLWADGTGTPVIVVPGVMADARAFEPVATAFGEPGPVLVLDRRGRRLSGPLGADYSGAVEVADLRAWIGELGGPVRLFGWSYGATIVLETAAIDDRVVTTVAFDPVLGPFAAEAGAALRAADLDGRVEIVNRDISRVPAEQVVALRASPAWAVLRELAHPLPDEHAAVNAFVPDPRWARVPARLILAELSRGTEPYGPAVDRAAARLPLATTDLLPGLGHLAHAENPAALGAFAGRLLRR